MPSPHSASRYIGLNWFIKEEAKDVIWLIRKVWREVPLAVSKGVRNDYRCVV